MSTVIIDEVAHVLSRAPVFQTLAEDVLCRLASTIQVEFYPRGTAIAVQGGPVSEYIQIVVSGAVRVSMSAADGTEVNIDLRSEGDLIGYLLLAGADRMLTNVMAVEETVCYLIPRESFVELLETQPSVREYFSRTLLSRYMDKAFSELRNSSQLFDSGERLLFTTSVGELATREVITARCDIAIQAAAQIMSRNRVSALVLADAGDHPVGILTDRDLREKVAAVARDQAEPVANIMSRTLLRADARNSCFEALLTMIHHNVHHLLVEEEGRLRGMITNHDFTLLQGTSPLAVAREIESQQHLDGLAATAKKFSRLVGLLLKEGARASNITRIITEINDRLVRRILELIERRLGPAPLPWCWIVFGSEGRKEQTFKTDQDNAIVFAPPASAEEDRRAREWFGAFTERARDALTSCCLPVCSANYMASNPRWCQPLATWKGRFSEWIANPTAEALLQSVVFFDFRPLYGAEELAVQLRDHLGALIEQQPAFLGFMANQLVRNRPPIGFFQQFVVEKDGEHKDELNLKLKGIAQIVDLVRFFSLEKGVRETATLERLQALRERHTIVQAFADEIEQAFEFIMLLRVHHQYRQIAQGLEPDNFINPDSLSNLERKTIKEAFQLISRIQNLIIERYRASIW